MAGLLKPERTFCGVPYCADPAELSADVAVFGAPHGTPYQPGTPSHAAGAPKAVREALGKTLSYGLLPMMAASSSGLAWMRMVEAAWRPWLNVLRLPGPGRDGAVTHQDAKAETNVYGKV